MSLIRNCRMMARGDDWVKLLVDVAYNDRIPCVEKLKNEHDLLWHRLKVSHPAMGDGPGGYGRPEVMKSGLWKDRVVFKFKIKPYSEEVNDLFQYVYDFGELADKRTEREAEGARFMEGLRGISESIMRLAGGESRGGIRVPEMKTCVSDESGLDSSSLVVSDNGGASMVEPGIRFGGREVRSLASRFEKHGII